MDQIADSLKKDEHLKVLSLFSNSSLPFSDHIIK